MGKNTVEASPRRFSRIMLALVIGGALGGHAWSSVTVDSAGNTINGSATLTIDAITDLVLVANSDNTVLRYFKWVTE